MSFNLSLCFCATCIDWLAMPMTAFYLPSSQVPSVSLFIFGYFCIHGNIPCFQEIRKASGVWMSISMSKVHLLGPWLSPLLPGLYLPKARKLGDVFWRKYATSVVYLFFKMGMCLLGDKKVHTFQWNSPAQEILFSSFELCNCYLKFIHSSIESRIPQH